MKLEEVLRFVGVTGLPGAGKGAFIDLLRPLLAESGVDTRYYSLSDELRAEAQRRDRDIERPVLRAIANELRLKHGSGVLSNLVVDKIREELKPLSPEQPLVVIIDAIRNPEEVLVLRQELGHYFTLASVEAPLDLLIDRIAARARFDEPDEFVQQKEAARKMILGESGRDEPAHGHNITECVAMADYHIDNSQSLDTLSAHTSQFIEEAITVRTEKSKESGNGH